MKKLSLISFLLIYLVFGCSPVKTRYNVPKETITQPVLSNEAQKQPSQSKPKKFEYRSRFNDTSIIILDNISREKITTISKDMPLDNNDRFTKALNAYDNDNMNFACSEFEDLAKVIQPVDNVFYELQFYRIECLIVNEKLIEAESYLLDWLSFDKLPDITKQKMMVRLGQVYCLEKKTDEAHKTFTKFQKEYPDSELLPFANCDILKK